MSSRALQELLFKIRQDPAFKELMTTIEVPELKPFKQSFDPLAQYADYIFRSGMQRQHNAWREFLIGEPSQKEKP